MASLVIHSVCCVVKIFALANLTTNLLFKNCSIDLNYPASDLQFQQLKLLST